ILEQLKGKKFSIDKVNKRERRRNPAQPFITSSLQQEAARKLNFRARKTMMVAQQLYEGIDLGKKAGGITGLITYMRTDSTRISDSAKQEAKGYIAKTFGKKYVGYNKKSKQKKGAQDAHEAIRPKTIKKIEKKNVENTKKSKQKKGAQDAHEAIRPTSVMRDPKSLKAVLSQDQYRLYKLIWERFVASQMAPAIMDTMTVHLYNNDIEFRATGSKDKFKGFMSVYVEGKDDKKKGDEKFLPDVSEGMVVDAKKITPNQHFTQPPPRYTEARLVRAMEEKGIGR